MKKCILDNPHDAIPEFFSGSVTQWYTQVINIKNYRVNIKLSFLFYFLPHSKLKRNIYVYKNFQHNQSAKIIQRNCTITKKFFDLLHIDRNGTSTAQPARAKMRKTPGKQLFNSPASQLFLHKPSIVTSARPSVPLIPRAAPLKSAWQKVPL